MARVQRKRQFRKKQVRKKGFNRKGHKNSNIMSKVIHRPVTLPDSAFVKLKWADNTSNYITIPAGTAYQYRQIRGNSAYDPIYAIGGTSAYGYTEWGAFYEKVRVHGSKIRVRFSKMQNSLLDSPLRVAVFPINQTPTNIVYTVAHSSQQPYNKSGILGIGGGNASMVTLSQYMSTKKIEGSDCAQYDVSFASGISSVPINQFYWIITAQTLDGSILVNDVSVLCEVEVTYYCEFYSRRDLSLTVQQITVDPIDPPNEPEITGPGQSQTGYLPTGPTGATGPRP